MINNKIKHTIKKAQKYILFLFALLCTSWLNNAMAKDRTIERVVYVINKEALTIYDINKTRVFLTLQNKLTKQNKKIGNKELEDFLINYTIQKQACDKFGIFINDEQLLNTIKNIASGQKKTILGFKRSLNKTPNGYKIFNEFLKNQIRFSTLNYAIAREGVKITNTEIDDYILNSDALEYSFDYILLYKKNKNIEKEIINSLKSNNLNAIKNIAKKHKDTMRYIKYNAIKMAQIPSSLVTYLPKHSGKINTFRNENGVNFIKLKSKSLKDLSKPIYQYKIQHILLVAPSDADKKIRKNEIYKIYNSLLKSKDKYSQFNALALLKNEDSNTKNNNGEMDWRAIKELSPSIAKYIVKARKNQISKPIKTIQGWHIVRLLDTRKKSFGMKEYRKAIKRFLFQEQMPMVVSNWLKTTRINAYIRKIDKNGNEKKITNPSQ